MSNYTVTQPAVDVIEIALDNVDNDWNAVMDDIAWDLNDWTRVADATFAVATDVATRVPSIIWTVPANDLPDFIAGCVDDDVPFAVINA